MSAADRIDAAVRRWGWIAGIAVVGIVVIFWLAVLTPQGQAWEDAALAGSRQAGERQILRADDVLDTITVWSLAAATAVVGIIGLVRGGVRLAAAGVGIIVVALGITEVLKRYILQRPHLTDAPMEIHHNSFPSGHTTIAMSVLLAVLVVVPWRWRGLAMLLVMGWAVGIGAYTVTAHWHRLSDTLGADLVALTVGCVMAILLARSGMVRVVRDRARAFRVVYVVLAALVAVAAGGSAVLLAVTGAEVGVNPTPQYRAYLEAQAWALAGSVVTALVAWGSWRRLEVVPAGSRARGAAAPVE